MTTYKIVGPYRVCDHEPGSTVTDDDLAGADVQHLIGVGHIEPITTPKAGKAEPTPTIQED